MLAEARSARVKYGDRYLEQWDALAELEHLDRCIYETVRIAQQSITLRLVRTPLAFTTVHFVKIAIDLAVSLFTYEVLHVGRWSGVQDSRWMLLWNAAERPQHVS